MIIKTFVQQSFIACFLQQIKQTCTFHRMDGVLFAQFDKTINTEGSDKLFLSALAGKYLNKGKMYITRVKGLVVPYNTLIVF